MAKYLNYMSCVVLLLAASYVMYGSIDLTLWDSQMYALISFASIFVFAAVMFYKENVQYISANVYDLLNMMDNIVRIVAMPFFTTQILVALNIHPQGNYVPAIISACLWLQRTFQNEDQLDAKNVVVYTSALALAVAGYTNQKICCALAGPVFALGEYCEYKNIIPFDMMPYAIFNYFLAGFTLLAFEGILEC